jgi:hypothetical protein
MVSMLASPHGDFVVAVDSSGKELGRSLVAPRAKSAAMDAGSPATPSATPHPPMLVDGQGTVVFATPGGDVGTISRLVNLRADGSAAGPATVELLSQACSSGAPSWGRTDAAVTGLAPLSPGAFVAVCRSGMVVTIKGADD